jgi:hypothetical protein
MQKITQERIERNHNYLIEVFELTKDNFVPVVQENLMRKYNLSSNAFHVMFKMGWMARQGQVMNSKYKWKVKEPTVKMARMFIEECSNETKNYRERLKIAKLKNEKGIVGMVTTQKLPVINNTIQKRLKYNNLKSKENNNIENQKEVKNKEFSLMWGLIKIKY